jgi:PAS domain S-box-containing protein
MATQFVHNHIKNDSPANQREKETERFREPVIQGNQEIRVPKRKSAELRLAAQQATTAILAESTTLEEATPRILQVVCESLGWSLGQLWRVDPKIKRLRCGEIWKSPKVEVTEFADVSRQILLASGVELPGRIWANGQPAWIPDITKEKQFARAPFAALAGLHGAFGFPIAIGREVLGVIEFYSQEIRHPNNALLAMMATIGGQIGQFIERKRAEHQLLESEKRFQAFMDNSPAVAFMKDMDGRYVYVNELFKRSFGFGDKEWLGKTDHDLWPAEFAQQYRQSDLAVLSGDSTKEVIHTCPSGAGGATTEWLVLKFPFQDAAGRRFLGGMALDITERKKTEEKLRQTEDQFRQVQKMEAIGRLAGGVAHDFNNLLTIILGYSELVLGRLEPADTRRELIVQIKNAGDRAASLTRQLLAFSRQQVLAPKVLDLNVVVTDTEKMLRRLIGEDITLTTVLDPKIGRVKADPGQIEQVIMNLVVNARDAMPEGGRLTIETGNVELDEAYAKLHTEARPGDYVMLAVSDTGCGMDEAVKARIFEPFFTTKEAGKGTGLGLATVYGIVNQSGGSIYVYSEVGRGTTFKIYLPLVDAKTPSAPQTAPGKIPSGKETLLLVEDEEVVRAMTRQILETCGYRILEAGHGAEAIQTCEQSQGPIHLLVTDVVMPGIGGRQLAETLRSKHPELKVLFLSGYTDDAVVRHGVLEAGTNFLQKPFTPSSLAQKVREVLDKEK